MKWFLVGYDWTLAEKIELVANTNTCFPLSFFKNRIIVRASKFY
jgi:hypothetical protein